MRRFKNAAQRCLQGQLSATPRRVMGGARGVWRGDGEFVGAWLARGLPRPRFRYRREPQPEHVNRVQPDAAAPGRG
jgi:hypothetical protein